MVDTTGAMNVWVATPDELLEALKTLDRWPEKVRLMQENWIGRSEGARVKFPLSGRSDVIEVFTTRPDTLFGASFIAIAANHPLAQEMAKDDPALDAFGQDLLDVGIELVVVAGPDGIDEVRVVVGTSLEPLHLLALEIVGDRGVLGRDHHPSVLAQHHHADLCPVEVVHIAAPVLPRYAVCLIGIEHQILREHIH